MVILIPIRISLLKIFFLQLFLLTSCSEIGEKDPEKLVNVKDIIPDIEIDLKYATSDNFTKEILYQSNTCFLAYGALKNLKLVQDSLRNIRMHNGITYNEGLGLKVWDGYRPRSVQFRMWEIMPDARYVADPEKGSSHNRGGAVDITIIDFSTKNEINMPTDFDFFGIEAHHQYMGHPSDVIANRTLLKNIMTIIGGFSTYQEEWWHYKFPESDNYPLRDIQIK
ncbi:MAG: M15 family metallopeptidase [Candidatus Neomarinimicrobiota bacterium]|nr:M15 family metallopeptidase [Candidatus Neomarinimicrobiota bacterium]